MIIRGMDGSFSLKTKVTLLKPFIICFQKLKISFILELNLYVLIISRNLKMLNFMIFVIRMIYNNNSLFLIIHNRMVELKDLMELL